MEGSCEDGSRYRTGYHLPALKGLHPPVRCSHPLVAAVYRLLCLLMWCTCSDLKSHNLLVDENQKIKVCDFGFSRQVTGNKDEPMTLCGTDEWMVWRHSPTAQRCCSGGIASS